MKKKKPAPRRIVNVTGKIRSRQKSVKKPIPGLTIRFSEARNLGTRVDQR